MADLIYELRITWEFIDVNLYLEMLKIVTYLHLPVFLGIAHRTVSARQLVSSTGNNCSQLRCCFERDLAIDSTAKMAGTTIEDEELPMQRATLHRSSVGVDQKRKDLGDHPDV